MSLKDAEQFEVIEVTGWVKRPQPDVVELVRQRMDEEVSLDALLYICQESRQTFEASVAGDPGGYELRRCFPFDQAFTHRLALGKVRGGHLVREMCQWYRKRNPVLAYHGPLTLEGSAAFGASLVRFEHDLRLLREKVASSEALGTEVASDAAWWEQVAFYVAATFPQRKVWILAYLRWRQNAGRGPEADEIPVPQLSEEQLRSIPPQGRYVRMHMALAKERFFAAEEDGGGGRLGRLKLEERARSQVQEAVVRLKKELDLDEVPLPLENSLVRRMQHRFTADAGLYSRSEAVPGAESEDKRVVVMRRSPGPGDLGSADEDEDG